MTWIENKARFTLIKIKAYIHMSNQAYFKQLKEKHKIFQIFCMQQVYKKLSLLEFPLWGQNQNSSLHKTNPNRSTKSFKSSSI